MPKPSTATSSSVAVLHAVMPARPERESKNYAVLGVVPIIEGKSSILIGNDGRVYLHKSLAAQIPAVSNTVVIELRIAS